jgi:phosphatidate cytidylyltransferase
LTPLSPGKSVEGALAGALATVIVCSAVAALAGGVLWYGTLLGAVIAVAAPLGDLVESFWKRELGVKDLGTLLPGHGGVLDRCDSLLFAAPVIYFLDIWRQ